MSVWQEVSHQSRLVGLLTRALREGKLAHATLFIDRADIAKKELIIGLSAALQCENVEAPGCGVCSGCERVIAGIHPDCITLEPTGASHTIAIDTIRTQVVARCGLPSHEGKALVFVIHEAQQMQDAAANALLKTLEEPPANAYFLLGTTAPSRLLPTIRSRCQKLVVSRTARVSADVPQTAGEEQAAQWISAAEKSTLLTMLQKVDEMSGDRQMLQAACRDVAAVLHERAVHQAWLGHVEHAHRAGSASMQAVLLESQLSMFNGTPTLAATELLYNLRSSLLS